MNIEKILESINDKEFTLSLAGNFRTVNRPEDGYQPSGDGKIAYFMGDTKLGEAYSPADSSRELEQEIENKIRQYQILLEHLGYACQVKGCMILARRKIPV